MLRARGKGVCWTRTGLGNGLVFIDHRFSVRRVMSAMRKAGFGAEDFDNQVEEYQFDMLGNRKHLGYCVHEWHVCREAFLAGLWAAWIVHLWTRLFRTQISCCSYAFYSRWFVDEQVMTSTFNLVEVRDMDLTNKRSDREQGKKAEGGWGLQGRDFTVFSAALGLGHGPKHNFSILGPASDLGREVRRATWWKKLGVVSVR